MGLRWTLVGLLLLMTGTANAQVSTRAVPSPAGVTSAPSAVVRNEPFSADVITLYDRTLDNGGRIHRETRGKIFRDSQGRMRTDSEMLAIQPGTEKFEHITIHDPVQKVIINLNLKNKTATIFHFGQEVGPTAPIGVPSTTVSGSPHLPATQPVQKPDGQKPTPGVITTSKIGAKLGTTGVGTKTEALGNKIIEGVNAVGTRTTRILDAGLMGNEKPIVSVTETWFSPELKMTVLSEADDGQWGRTTMKLINVVRTEPMAQLFQVPSDYTVKDSAPATASVKH